MYWIGKEPASLTSNNTYTDNLAVYGSDFASNASAIVQIESNIYDTQHNTTDRKRYLNEPLTAIASG